MKFQKAIGALAGVLSISMLAGCSEKANSTEKAGGTPAPTERIASDVVNTMRLKQLAKGLELTDEQQQKVKAIFAAEAVEIAKWDTDPAIHLPERTTLVTDLKAVTNEKIKPVLNPDQLAKFQQQIDRTQKRKKAN